MTPTVDAASEVPAVERQIAHDMARRALPVAPVLILAGAAFWGLDGALAAAYGVALIVGNLLLSAALLTWGARRSAAALGAAALGGFGLRLVILGVAVFAVHPFWHFPVVPLCITLLVTHLGLLVWEMRYVSATLAHPGLKPGAEFVLRRPRPSGGVDDTVTPR